MFACVRVCPIYEYHRCRREWGKDIRLRRKWKKTNVCFFSWGIFLPPAQVSTAVDDKLKQADELIAEKRDALGEPAKSVFSKAKGLFGCKLDCCTIA